MTPKEKARAEYAWRVCGGQLDPESAEGLAEYERVEAMPDDDAKEEAPPLWNPRYVAFARVHGRTPEAQMAHDEEHWVGKMTGFMLWVSAQWRAWYKVNYGHDRSDNIIKGTTEHASFDAMLAALPACTGCKECEDDRG